MSTLTRSVFLALACAYLFVAVVAGGDDDDDGPTCTITDYGASTTASAATNVAAVQAAFAACNNNNGRVVIPAGVFPISNVEVEHVNGTTVLFQGKLQAQTASQAGGNNNAIFKIKHATHIEVIGQAQDAGLDGQGSTWWSGTNAINAPPLFELEESTNVQIADLTLANPGTLGLSIKVSSSVIIEGLNVKVDGPSTDVVGVSIKDTCTDVSVKYSFIAASYACVNVEGGWAPGCTSSIVLQRNTCNGAGVLIGPMQVYGGYCIKDVTASAMTVANADVGVLVGTVPNMGPVPSGGALTGVSVTSSTFQNVKTGLIVTEAASAPPHIEAAAAAARLRGAAATVDTVPVPVSSISFSGISGTVTGSTGEFTGATGAPLAVSLDNINLMGGSPFTCSMAKVSVSGSVSPSVPASCLS